MSKFLSITEVLLGEGRDPFEFGLGLGLGLRGREGTKADPTTTAA